MVFGDGGQPDPVVHDDGATEPCSQLSHHVDPRPGRKDHGGDHIAEPVDDAGQRNPDRPQAPGIQPGYRLTELSDDRVELCCGVEGWVHSVGGGDDQGGAGQVGHHDTQAVDADVDAGDQPTRSVKRVVPGWATSSVGASRHLDDQIVTL